MIIDIESMSYKDNLVFSSTHLEIEKNKFYMLIGKNGTGKTTLMKIISSLINDYKGHIDYQGQKVNAYLDGFSIPSSYSGIETAKLILSTEEFIKFKSISSKFNIDYYYDRKYSTYFLGMRLKLALCLVFSMKGDVLLLDEPFNGLDEDARNNLIYLINEEKKSRTIVISTHVFNSLYSYADKVILIENKKLILKEMLTQIYRVKFSSYNELSKFITEFDYKNAKVNDKTTEIFISNENLPKFKKDLSMFDFISFEKVGFEYEN